MTQATRKSLQEQIDSLLFHARQELVDRSTADNHLTARLDLLTKAIKHNNVISDQANDQITALTNQVNKLTGEMAGQIYFQRWFFEEMGRLDNEPPIPFDPPPIISSQPTLKIVK
jgi:hypothetical protein